MLRVQTLRTRGGQGRSYALGSSVAQDVQAPPSARRARPHAPPARERMRRSAARGNAPARGREVDHVHQRGRSGVVWWSALCNTHVAQSTDGT
jgi:hypothetical protein